MIIDTTQTKIERDITGQIQRNKSRPIYSTVELFKMIGPDCISSFGYFENTEDNRYCYAYGRELCPAPAGHFAGEGDVLNFSFIPPSDIPKVECIDIKLIDCLDIEMLHTQYVGAVQRDGRWLFFNFDEMDLFLTYKKDYCDKVRQSVHENALTF